MDSFWAGIVGALIGALVGGAFTTVAAIVQVRGALEAARIQADLAAKVARESRARDHRLSAAQQLLDINNTFYQTLRKEHDSHIAHGMDDCPPRMVFTDLAKAARAARGFSETRGDLLPPSLQTELDDLYSCLDVLVGNDERNITRYIDPGENRCIYGHALDFACEKSERLEMGLRGFVTYELNQSSSGDRAAV